MQALSKSRLVEAQVKSGRAEREKAGNGTRLQNRTEMRTDVQDLKSPAEESVLYFGGNGQLLRFFLKGLLLTHRLDKPFREALRVLCFSGYLVKPTGLSS